LYHNIQRLIVLGKMFMLVCYVDPHFARYNDRPHEFDILMRVYNYSLAHPEGITLKLLTAMLNISQPAVSMTVSRLVEKGYLVRNPGVRDRRCCHLTIASGEKDFMDRMALAQAAAAAEILREMPQEKQEHLFSFIEEMNTYFENLPSKPMDGEAQ
ncbi:MAG: helix-turn-helix domain-containing protein, partial [Akkermansia muciniphila]|nr:helix-turn-helix domain-containing protein [Akkermansia muciniphila]